MVTPPPPPPELLLLLPPAEAPPPPPREGFTAVKVVEEDKFAPPVRDALEREVRSREVPPLSFFKLRPLSEPEVLPVGVIVTPGRRGGDTKDISGEESTSVFVVTWREEELFEEEEEPGVRFKAELLTEDEEFLEEAGKRISIVVSAGFGEKKSHIRCRFNLPDMLIPADP